MRSSQGYWNHIAPFGYKNIREEKSNRSVVIVDDVEAPIVKDIFELYATGNYTLESLVSEVVEQCNQ